VRREAPRTAIVIMTTYTKIPDAVDTIRDGAVDYVAKPFDPETFAREIVKPIDERLNLRKKFEEARTEFVGRQTGAQLVGTSAPMRRLARGIEAGATSDASVMITGDHGTGKKLVARTIHAQSARREGPLVIIPCSSLPELMLDAEVTGLVRAAGDRRDEWFDAARGGTLVLDGMEGLPLSAQSRLLRVIDEPEARARRDAAWRPLGVRLICTTSESTARWVAERRFLAPLLYRLHTLHLPVPSLAERDEGDLYLLACHFLAQLTPPGRRSTGLTARAWDALRVHSFRWNVRELAWAIESGMAAAGGKDVDFEHLPPAITSGQGVQ
jgi:DNA-binding NtrC family response regulator